MDKTQITISTYDKMAEKYTKEFFDYAEDNPIIDKFLMDIPAKGKILDMGCGPGNVSNYLASQGYEVTGIDLSDEMLKIAQQKVPKVTFKKMDMRSMDFPKRSFDGVVMAYSLIHIASSEIPQVLTSIYDVLEVGGEVLIIAQKGKSDQMLDEPLMPGEKTFNNFFTLGQLEDFLSKAGFSVTFQKEAPLHDAESLSDAVLYVIARK